MGQLFYTIFVKAYSWAIRIAAAWNPKAKLWVNGRSRIFDKIAAELQTIDSRLSNTDSHLVWMHCASLGEFEQGRPLLEQLRIQNSTFKIVLTFFSPSGYEVMKDYKGADHVFYLPMDSPSNAARFIDAVKPSLVLWVKYEYWFYYLSALKKKNIPVILVSGIFREHHPFFRWYGSIWRQMLGCFTYFFVQNESSKELLESIHIDQPVMVNGDTRFDRVLAIERNFQPVPHIEAFCGTSLVIVAGSTWEEDEVELLHFVRSHPEIKFILAPHEVDAENLEDVKKEFPGSIFYSELERTTTDDGRQTTGEEQPATDDRPQTTNGQRTPGNVLIIDNIGMLSRLYKYATIAYVGGGFGADGVHNVLEAAVYAKPVVFGPVYEKFDEAIGLVDAGGAATASGPLSLEALLRKLFNDEGERNAMGMAAGKFVQDKAGASSEIIRFIQEKRLLTS